MSYILSDEQLSFFNENGFLVIPEFYELEQIYSIRQAIYNIISLVIEKNGLEIERVAYSPDKFDANFTDVISLNRSLGGEIYDAVKQIPAFVRLCCSPKHDAIMFQIRHTDLAGIAAGGYGVRIDIPQEERYRAGWHQDYPAQFRSMDGLVFWSPLVPMTKELGPVKICIGSHKDGLVRVHTNDSNRPDKKGAYGLVFENEEEIVKKYESLAPLLSPTDLLILDFLTIHSSGTNVDDRARWSMQIRYFNFREPTGIKLGWVGSFAAGVDVGKIHPDIFID